MKTRILLAPALLGVLTLMPLAGATAAVPPGGDASLEVDSTVGNAPDPIDITHVHVFKTTADYRAVVTYTDLTPRKATRWLVEFVDFNGLSPDRRAAARRMVANGEEPTGVKANLVEFRVSPSGRESSFGYKINDSNSQSTTIQRATCSLPQRAVANYGADTITYIVPRRCWKPTSGSVFAGTLATEYSSTTWDGTSVPTPAEDSATDSQIFGWTYRAPVIQ